jgi:hypothetical protein
MNGLASDVSLGAKAKEEEEPVENAVLEDARGAVKASHVEAKRATVAMAENFMLVVVVVVAPFKIYKSEL